MQHTVFNPDGLSVVTLFLTYM